MRGVRVGIVFAVALSWGCSREPQPPTVSSGERLLVERALAETLARATARADSIEQALQPVPLLRPAEESGLRHHLQSTQLVAARRLGVPRASDSAQVAALRRDGRLVELAGSNRFWVVRELDHSLPLATPDVPALLSEIGERFQTELADLGLPPYRLEITSALRTAETQAALRRANPNAAAEASSHEYGTTVDVAYSSFAAPASTADDPDATDWLRPHLARIGDAFIEAAAARKSRELQAILGRVLLEMQAEGKVYVTLERQQPVYHMTVARRLAPTG